MSYVKGTFDRGELEGMQIVIFRTKSLHAVEEIMARANTPLDYSIHEVQASSYDIDYAIHKLNIYQSLEVKKDEGDVAGT